MGLFKFDLIRSFAIGFLMGAAGLALWATGDLPAGSSASVLAQAGSVQAHP